MKSIEEKMSSYRVTGYNNHGGWQAVYVTAKNSIDALVIGQKHGLINQIKVKKTNIKGGFTE